MLMHEVWRRVRRPFRYPSCKACVWEVYDANLAGCVRCGRCHECQPNAVDTRCRLVQCEDASRACDITGFVLPEVRHAVREYTDTAPYHEPTSARPDLEPEVRCIVHGFLHGQRARAGRLAENAKLCARLQQHLYKALKTFKIRQPGRAPNLCHMLAAAVGRERNWRFIEEASEPLVDECSRCIARCLLDLQAKGVKLACKHRMRELVCGLLFMLQNGLIFRDQVLLPAIPEVQRCLPPENKLHGFFGVSSKIICMTENEVKMVFREHYKR
jgi:hypothetical protein